MNSYLINKLLSAYIVIKARYKEKECLRQCLTGPGLEIGSTASCLNAGPRENIRIGMNVTIHGVIETQGKGTIEIGDYTNIRFNTHIGAVNSIKIGKYVIISHSVYIYDNNNHPTSPARRKELSESRFDIQLNSWTNADSVPIVIEDNVWIGFGSVILKGVRIGKGSIVGAHAVVTEDIPPFSVAVGNPARIVKTLSDDLLK